MSRNPFLPFNKGNILSILKQISCTSKVFLLLTDLLNNHSLIIRKKYSSTRKREKKKYARSNSVPLKQT